MPKPKNDPITVTLPAHVVNMLTQWARLDCELMQAKDRPARLKLREQRAEWANEIAGDVLQLLPVSNGAKDLADAINERTAIYAADHVTQSALAAQAAKAENVQRKVR